MSKLNYGNRVAIYSASTPRMTGRIHQWLGEDCLGVTFDKPYLSRQGDMVKTLIVHPKQCRLLKKKERRRVWVQYKLHDGDPWAADVFDNLIVAEESGICKHDLVEFVEVRKK